MLVEQYENKRQAQPLPLGHHCMIGFISARANEVLSWRVLTPYSIQKRRVNIDILLFSPGILNNRGLFRACISLITPYWADVAYKP